MVESLSSPAERRARAIQLTDLLRDYMSVTMASRPKHDYCDYERESGLDAPPCYWVVDHTVDPDGPMPGGVVIYFHGGGMMWGTFEQAGRSGLAPKISRSADASVLFVDYKLLPENSTEEAIDDCVRAYRFVTERMEPRVPASAVTLMGDSSGGYLAIMTALRIRDQGLAMPASLVLVSPDTDLTLSGESSRKNTQDWIKYADLEWTFYLMRDFGAKNAMSMSPLFMSLRGLPPMLVQVGALEAQLDDARRFAGAAVSQGISVELRVWDNCVHAWQYNEATNELAHKANEEIADFIKRHVRWATSTGRPVAGGVVRGRRAAGAGDAPAGSQHSQQHASASTMSSASSRAAGDSAPVSASHALLASGDSVGAAAAAVVLGAVLESLGVHDDDDSSERRHSAKHYGQLGARGAGKTAGRRTGGHKHEHSVGQHVHQHADWFDSDPSDSDDSDDSNGW